jgi:adenylosuccinate synthase
MNYKAIGVIGLGYGDEGKGSIIDYLASLFSETLVIRFCGGHQAAHHVVRDDTWHCFSQFGSGTFSPTSLTYLHETMLVEPFSLVREYNVLLSKGIADPKPRLKINESCCITTPYHKLMGRIGDILHRRGTTGLGVGAAHSDKIHGKMIRIKDLSDRWYVKARLAELSVRALGMLEEVLQKVIDPVMKSRLLELKTWADTVLNVSHFARLYHKFYQEWRSCFVDSPIVAISKDCVILFEGAQGILLDPNDGFAPYVTKTSCVLDEYHPVFDDLCLRKDEVFKIGLMRCYPTRHGPGPFVTEDSLLKDSIEKDHNKENQWQGPLRVGWFDAVALEYSLFVSKCDGVVLTHADKVWSGVRACTSYRYTGPLDNRLHYYFTNVLDECLSIKQVFSLSDRLERTRLLERCEPYKWTELPRLNKTTFDSARRDYHLTAPLIGISYGPTRRDKTLDLGEYYG